MKVEATFPPNYEEITETFQIKGRSGIIFTYGDTIHNPSRIDITPDLFAHEAIHERQQGSDPKSWWERYLVDSEFRFAQELEAYRAQYAFASEHYGRPLRRKLLNHISGALAGPLYGNLMSPQEAKAAILA